MLIKTLISKIHSVKVTDGDLKYIRIITLDKKLMNTANIFVREKVQFVKIDNGGRLGNYVVEGRENSVDVTLVRQLARKFRKNDPNIISYAQMSIDEAKSLKPNVVIKSRDQ